MLVEGLSETEINSLRTFSPSQLRVYDNCPKEWHYSYNEELWRPSKGTHFFDFGNYAHELAHATYQLMQAGNYEPGSVFIQKGIEQKVRNDLTGPNITLLADVWPRILAYIINQSPKIDNGITILGVEREYKVPVQTPNGHIVALHGFTDLLYRDKAGNVRIRDHKTGADPRTHSAESVKLDDQLLFYAVAWSLFFGEPILDVEINFISSKILKTKQVPLNECFNLYRYQHTPVGLAIAQANILAKIDRMLDTEALYNYSPRCKFCTFFDICTLEQRGMNTTGLVRETYNRGGKKHGNKSRPSSTGEVSNIDSGGDKGFTISFTDI